MRRRGKVAAKSSIEPRSWSSEWIGQTIGRCTTCERERPVMLIENEACVCEDCHEARLEKWRADDIEAERREMMWDAWTMVADRRAW
jgi:hypothetical protein